MRIPLTTFHHAARALACTAALASMLPAAASGSTATGEPVLPAGAPSEYPLVETGPASPPARGRCRPTIEVSATQILSGEAVTVSGTLQCPEGTDPAGQTVTLYERSSGGSRGFAAAASAITEADGSYHVTAAELSDNMVLFVRSARGRSPHRLVRVAPVISLQGPPDGSQLWPVRRGAGAPSAGLSSTVTFSGTVTPAAPEELVVLQRELPAGSGRWRRVAVTHPDEAGIYSVTHKFRRAGEAVVRVVVRSRGRRPVAASAPVSYVIE